MLAIRALSLLRAMFELLRPDTFDSYDVLVRALIESRDLLTTFRFDDAETRAQVQRWFKDKAKDTWIPKHRACEQFLKRVGGGNLELARRWGQFSERSHPKYLAANNSVAIVGGTLSFDKHIELIPALEEKRADYITALVSLYVAASFDFAGWVSLQCDFDRVRTVQQIKDAGPRLIYPLLDRVERRNARQGMN